MSTQNKLRGIVYTPFEVKAALAGATQVRRVIKPQPPAYIDDLHGGKLRKRAPYRLEHPESGQVVGFGFQDDNDAFYRCPFGVPGETHFAKEAFWHGTNSFTDPSGEAVAYWTSRVQYLEEREKPGPWEKPYVSGVPWMLKRPSIHMKQSHARLFRTLVTCRVERVQDATEADAVAMGVERNWMEDIGDKIDPGGWNAEEHGWLPYCGHKDGCECYPAFTARESLRGLWNKHLGPGAWDRNDWVWVGEFQKCEGL